MGKKHDSQYANFGWLHYNIIQIGSTQIITLALSFSRYFIANSLSAISEYRFSEKKPAIDVYFVNGGYYNSISNSRNM